MYGIRYPAAKAGTSNLESQLSMAVSLANTTLDSVNRLTDLNVNLARATLEHTNFLARQLMSATDRQELLTVLSAQAQPNARRSFDYAYYLTNIFTCAQMDFIQIVSEGIADTNRRIASLASLVRSGGKDFGQNRRRKIQVTGDSEEGNTIAVVVVSERSEPPKHSPHRGAGPATLQ